MVDESSKLEVDTFKQIMEYEAWLDKIAKDEDREFAFLDSKMNFKNFDLKLFGEIYDANDVEAEVMRFVDLWNFIESYYKIPNW